MITRYLLLCLSILQFTIATAQDSTTTVPAFGKVTLEELRLNNCSFAPEASAMNLIKYKEIELSVFPNGSTELVILTRYRLKIFDKKGYQHATITIPFSKDNRLKIHDIQAATYNISGTGQIEVTTVKEEDIFKTDVAKKEKYKLLKFTFPDIKEGSVIEYQYTQKYKTAYEVPTCYFQDDIPNLLTVYTIKRPLFTFIQKKTISDLPIEETHIEDDTKGSDKQKKVDSYILKNVPAFKREAYMSSARDYKYRMDFLLDRSASLDPHNIWFLANLWLLASPAFGGAFDANIPGTKKFIDSVKRLGTVPEKIRSVYGYVKQKIKWLHIYYKYARPLEEVWKEGEGTSAEINLSILNLLRKCDVRCFPVLYSTRQNGLVDYTFPDLSQFNTVNIAVVNDKKFDLLDGTNPYLSYETPPFNVVNRTGMLIDPVNHSKINIDFDRKLIWDSVFVSASITPEGLLKGNIVRKYFDLAKSMILQSAEEDNHEAKQLLQSESEIKVDTSWQEDAEKELLPLTEHATFHYEIPVTNDFLFINPFLFSDLTKNPFKDSARLSDVDFGASTASFVQIDIALPKGIQLDELPKNKTIYTPDSSINFTYQNDLKGDTLRISSSIEIKKPIFSKEDYPLLRATFEKIYSLLNNQILLQKKVDK